MLPVQTPTDGGKFGSGLFDNSKKVENRNQSPMSEGTFSLNAKSSVIKICDDYGG